MDPVEIQATVVLSRIADADVPFDRAVERAGPNGEAVVFGGKQLIDGCEAAWSPQTNVTATVEAGILNDCNKLAIASAFTTGLVATKDITSLDLSGYGYIKFLIKASIAVAAGVLQIGFSETVGMGGSPIYMDIPALEAGKWYYFSIAFGGTGTQRDAVVSIGLNAVSDPGTVDVYIDEVRAGAETYGIAGFCKDDIAKENDKAEQYEDMTILLGHVNAELLAGQTCASEQPLYPVPGDGRLTATEIEMAGASVRASEDQATAGGRVGVIV